MDAEVGRGDSQGEVTSLLAAWGKGDQSALNELMPLVYNELHRIAKRSWNGQNQGNTLQPTALINEAFLKLAGSDNTAFQNRGHFMAVACTAMRQVLVNHALSHRAAKRGSGDVAVSLDDVQLAVHQEAAEVVALHEALDRLQAVDSRKSKVVEMRYFGGFSIEEIAEALGVSVITVNRDWRLARAWLNRELSSERS
jgi:RNA polymerase sigma factor (TIGR02999 family)